MTIDAYNDQAQQAIRAIVAKLPKKSPPDLAAFTQQYFAKTPLPELEAIDPSHAAVVAATGYQFAARRKTGAPMLRVYTPDQAMHGWESTRIAIDIVNDDMPFLVDSVAAELTRQGFTIYELLHPIIRVHRGRGGELLGVGDKDNTPPLHESFMHIEVSPLPEGLTAGKLETDLLFVLDAVRLAVEDFPSILKKAEEAVKKLDQAPAQFDREEMREVKDFLTWLADKNYIFLGYIEYAFDAKGEQPRFTIVPGSELGIFKLEDLELKPKGLHAIPPEMLHFAMVPQLVEITKSNNKSLIHRPVHMDYIGIKRFDAKGNVVGECRFIGMYTSAVYYQGADTIPIIRRKMERALLRSRFEPGSHDGKALKTIFEFLPRDEIFQMSEDELFEFGMGILSVEAKPAVKLFVRKDTFERFLSCMVFIPRERFSTFVREQTQKILEKAFGGSVSAFYTQMTDSPLAQANLIIKTTPGKIPPYDIAAIEAEISRVTHQWSDLLMQELLRHHDEPRAEKLYRAYQHAFPKTYMNLYTSVSAVCDIQKINEAIETQNLTLEIFTTPLDPGYIHLKLYNPRAQVPLSHVLPMLEDLGFSVVDENPFLITPRMPDAKAGTDPHEDPHVWVRDLRLVMRDQSQPDIESMKALFEEAMVKIWSQDMASDGFNALVMTAGLAWRQVTLFRAYAKYLKQIGLTYSQASLEQVLVKHAAIARALLALFEARFAPGKASADTAMRMQQDIDAALSQVANLDEDRILRRFRDLMLATLRTNYFQMAADGKPKSYIAFKFNSAEVPELPLPRPYAEIFVYSVRVEGIHLRGGKVARGGLRWSDRHEDFRTEVLGLMKAQQVKNAVIVPVGSKGGFVVKNPPAEGGRDAQAQEGIACYKIFLHGLLDLTDNIVNGKVVAPQDVVRHDGDDPYLVVAADKGTATFSDIANAVSKEYGFWLGDAFASGGSAGYDHKKMGITAKGAWISVQRHFAEMGIDPQAQDFTVIGIGDMAGDVFGNGMLLSERIRLVGAFNHLHVFLDPNPDPKTSFAERKRMFDLPRSTWKDYSEKLISKGGGIYERSAKTIKLSSEARAALGISASELTPDELIKAMLKAPIDLLWNGGIGTYVKAESETHDMVGDRANNAVRVNGNELRCKVVGEGGNLGFTQRGRIEYAAAGGRINTDAIDNSAGVDCSDHEVNIKIALGAAIGKNKLSIQKRDALLATMTEEVAALVLKDNFLQTQSISIAELQGLASLDDQARLMRKLERKGMLDRAIEFLPADKALSELRAAKRGLTRPELSVLFAYSKLFLYKELVESTLPDAAYFERDLMRYFPEAMQENFAEEIKAHPLRREIIVTVVTNSIVNRVGITFFQGIKDDTGMNAADIAVAYTIARDAFFMRDIWEAIEAAPALDAKIRAELFNETKRFMKRVTLWFLRNSPQPVDPDKTMREYGEGIQTFKASFASFISPPVEKAIAKKLDYFASVHVPAPLARRIAELEGMTSACDVVKVANALGHAVPVVGKIHFDLGALLRLGWLRLCAQRILSDSHWQRLAILSVVDDLYEQQRRLTSAIITTLCDDTACAMSVEAWTERHRAELERYSAFMDDLKANDTLDLSMLMVAARNVKELASV